MSSTIAILPPSWGDGLTYSGANLRLLEIASLFPGIGGGLAPTRPRPGVIPQAGGGGLRAYPYSGMTIAVSSGFCIVPNYGGADQGAYVTGTAIDKTLAVDTADATNPRWDLVIVRVVDNGNSSSAATLEVVTGTPAASPSDPTIGGNFIVLARVVVPAGVATIASGNIQDGRNFTVPAGGILPTVSTTTISDVPNGQFRWNGDVGELAEFDGTNWNRVAHTAHPRGIIGKSTLTSNSGAWSNSTEITICQTSASFLSGRRYKICSHVNVGNAGGTNPSGDTMVVKHKVGVTQVGQDGHVTVSAATGAIAWSSNLGTYIDSISGGPYTISLTAVNLAGTGQHQALASSGAPAWMTIEDLGALV